MNSQNTGNRRRVIDHGIDRIILDHGADKTLVIREFPRRPTRDDSTFGARICRT